MINYYPLDVSPALFSTSTQAAINQLINAGAFTTSGLVATQRVHREAVRNIDNGRYVFSAAVPDRWRPTVARTLACDTAMQKLIRATIAKMCISSSGPTFWTAYYYPEAIGICSSAYLRRDRAPEDYRRVARLLMPRSETVGHLLDRRDSYDAMIAQWTRDMSEYGLDMIHLRPPHLDCLLTETVATKTVSSRATAQSHTARYRLTTDQAIAFTQYNTGTVH